MMNPLVSIVTVTYNSSATIADTLQSVGRQSYPNIEHIVVDGGSSDGTMEIVQNAARIFPYSIRYISEPDKGIYDAMNKGIAMAHGEIVGILNSDDVFFSPSVIESIVRVMHAERSDGCYGDLVFVDREDTSVVKRTWVSGSGNFRRGWVAPHPTLYLRRRAYELVGQYRTDFKISSDYDLMLRVFGPGSKLKIAYLPEFLVRMRDGGTSTRSLNSNKVGFRECQISLRSNGIRGATLINAFRVLRKFKQLIPYSRRQRITSHGLKDGTDRRIHHTKGAQH